MPRVTTPRSDTLITSTPTPSESLSPPADVRGSIAVVEDGGDSPSTTPRGPATDRRAALRNDPTSGQLRAKLSKQLDALAKDGLTKSELTDFKTQSRVLTADPAAADAAMRAALGDHIEALTADGADWVQDDLGRMDGHIAGYQRVLGAFMKNAQLIDANWNGKLDAGDLAVTPKAGGPGEVKILDDAMRDRIKINDAIVSAAWDMSKAGHAFATLDRQTFNRDLWNAETPQGTFALKSGVSPSKALEDVFRNPDKYQFECATAMVLTYYQAIRKLLGSDNFNEIAKDLRVGPWVSEDDLSKNIVISGSMEKAPEAFEGQLRPGEYTYFKNWDVSDEGRAQGWQGENVIYLGDGKYYGHPFGITTSQEILAQLDGARKPDSKIPASLEDIKQELSDQII